MLKKAKNPNEKTWYDCIVQVLQGKGEAMHYTDIADTIVKRKLRSNIGATLNQTVSVVLNASINKEGDKSPFKRVSVGVYALSGKVETSAKEKKEVEHAALTEPISSCSLSMRCWMCFSFHSRPFSRRYGSSQARRFGSKGTNR